MPVKTFNVQGKPELTMVWMDVEGDELLFTTAEGRRKPDNIRRDPRVIVSVQDWNNPQRTRSSMAEGESLAQVATRTLTSWTNVSLA
jgi:Pyridoxamine 5'-phosphate oxidase